MPCCRPRGRLGIRSIADLIRARVMTAKVSQCPSLVQDREQFCRTTLRDIYRRYRSDLCRYISRAFGNGPPEPEDIVQAAFYNFAALENPQAVRNPRALLYCIARNIAIRQHQREAIFVRDGAEQAHVDAENSDEIDPERVLMSEERAALLNEALTKMPEQRRKVLILNRLHGLSYAEISRRTGISQTQVKRLVAWALTDCKRALRKT